MFTGAHIYPFLLNGRTRRTPERVADHDNVVLDSIHTGLLVLGLGGLDDLVEGGEEAKSAEPPHETLGGINVLAVKVEAQLGRHAIVPDGVNVLDELFGGSCVRLGWVELEEKNGRGVANNYCEKVKIIIRRSSEGTKKSKSVCHAEPVLQCLYTWPLINGKSGLG